MCRLMAGAQSRPRLDGSRGQARQPEISEVAAQTMPNAATRRKGKGTNKRAGTWSSMPSAHSAIVSTTPHFSTRQTP
jgi:hypothetical protein